MSQNRLSDYLDHMNGLQLKTGQNAGRAMRALDPSIHRPYTISIQALSSKIKACSMAC